MSSPTSLGLPKNSDISYKRIFGIAFPIILSSLAQNLISLADTIFLGNLGEIQLGAAALAVIFYQVVYMTVFGFGVGAQIMMARRLGQGQKHAIGRIFQHALWFCLAAALLCWILYQFFGESMIFSMVHTEDTGRAVLDYLNVRVYGFPFAFACVAFNAFYVGIARTRNISIATLVMGVVNVVLDYVLVFGVWGDGRSRLGIGHCRDLRLADVHSADVVLRPPQDLFVFPTFPLANQAGGKFVATLLPGHDPIFPVVCQLLPFLPFYRVFGATCLPPGASLPRRPR